MPAHFPPAAKALVGALLTRQPRQRLGSCGAFGGRCGGAVDVACHPFFARIDWRALLAREVEAPVVPVVAAPATPPSRAALRTDWRFGSAAWSSSCVMAAGADSASFAKER